MNQQAYEIKFKEFIRMCAEAQTKGVDTVLVHHPETLGDNYSEMIESLNRLSAAGLKLLIIPPNERNRSKAIQS